MLLTVEINVEVPGRASAYRGLWHFIDTTFAGQQLALHRYPAHHLADLGYYGAHPIVAIRSHIEDSYKHALLGKLYRLADLMGQDCIAVVIAGEGRLVGPRSHFWPAFDPNLFVTV